MRAERFQNHHHPHSSVQAHSVFGEETASGSTAFRVNQHKRGQAFLKPATARTPRPSPVFFIRAKKVERQKKKKRKKLKIVTNRGLSGEVGRVAVAEPTHPGAYPIWLCALLLLLVNSDLRLRTCVTYPAPQPFFHSTLNFSPLFFPFSVLRHPSTPPNFLACRSLNLSIQRKSFLHCSALLCSA